MILFSKNSPETSHLNTRKKLTINVFSQTQNMSRAKQRANFLSKFIFPNIKTFCSNMSQNCGFLKPIESLTLGFGAGEKVPSGNTV